MEVSVRVTRGKEETSERTYVDIGEGEREGPEGREEGTDDNDVACYNYPCSGALLPANGCVGSSSGSLSIRLRVPCFRRCGIFSSWVMMM